MASIIDRGKGRPRRWQVKFRNDEGHQRSVSFRTMEEAKAYTAKVTVELNTRTYVDHQRGAITFGEFAVEVVPSIALRYRPTSRARTHSAMVARVLPRWQNVKLAAIHHTNVQNWVDEMSAELAPSTVHKNFQTFRMVIVAAVDARILPGLPWGRISMPTVEPHEARFLEPHEVDRLADMIGSELRAFVYLGAVCGLRAGELFGLRWREVDFDKRTVEIREIVTEANGVQHIGPPKTKASRRRVPMPAVVVDELELHRLTTADPIGFVFPATAGVPWRATNFRNRVWKPACERAGLDGLVIHELRHSAVAGWIASGAEPKEVAARAGHRSIVTIYDWYGHLFPSSAARLNDAIDEMYRAARSTGG